MKKIIYFGIISTLTLAVSLASTGSLSSLVFYEYKSTENGVNSGEFEVKRAYLTYQKELGENLKLKVQTDVGRLKNDSNNPNLYLYLKNARLDWKTGYGTFVFGLQGMNMFAVQEKTWGHRFVEKTPMDRNGFSSSADLGLGYYFKLSDKLQGSALLTNGSGYKKPEKDDYKKISMQLVAGEAKLSGKEGMNFGGVFSYEPYDADSVTVGSNSVAGVFGGWNNGMLTIGAEFDVMIDSESDDNLTVLSGYGQFSLNSKIAAFGRYDLAGQGDKVSYLIAGLDFNPAKGLTISPNLRFAEDKDKIYAVNFQFKF